MAAALLRELPPCPCPARPQPLPPAVPGPLPCATRPPAVSGASPRSSCPASSPSRTRRAAWARPPPPSTWPPHLERARRRPGRHHPHPVRVLRAGGPGRRAADHRPREGRRQPAPAGGRDRPHHARRQQPRAAGGGRDPQAFQEGGLQDRHPAQRAALGEPLAREAHPALRRFLQGLSELPRAGARSGAPRRSGREGGMSLADKRRPALGRGMAALLANAPAPSASTPIGGRVGLLSLPVEAVERNPDQPRKRFDDARLDELAASIRELGVVEPILVRRQGQRYRIVAGERRWRAAQRAGLKEIPALVREASDAESFRIALVENLQRADLNAIEEAEAYQALVDEHGLTQEAVAGKVGKERSTVANALRLLRLPEEVRDAVREGQLEMGHARALLGLEGAAAIRRAAARVLREKLSVRATEALVRELVGGVKKVGPGRTIAESPAVRALVQRLQRRLGCRCRVVPKSDAAGRIELDYTSLEELDGILDKIGA